MTAREPSIKNTKGRNFTRNIVTHSVEPSKNDMAITESVSLQ